MGFKCGIVGLPNVGKSTLFNALTETAAAQAANYPFCTIEPNVGVVTCVAPVHLGFFNSLADIARAKHELIQSLPAAGTAVLSAIWISGYIFMYDSGSTAKVAKKKPPVLAMNAG